MGKHHEERRTKGSGSIFLRRGKFVYQWQCQTGKIKTKTLNAATRDDAEKEVAEIVKEEVRLSAIDSKVAYIQQIAEAKKLLHICRVPLSEMEAAFFDHPSAPSITPEHRKNYHSTLSVFVEYAKRFNISTVADVTAEIAQGFLTFYWKRGIAPKTYNGALDILKRVFRTLNREDNPFEEFKKKQCTTEERLAFTIEQLQAIWEVLESDHYMLYKSEMIDLYKLALYTGARCGDLCLLKWTSVDLNHRIIRFVPHKIAHSSRKSVEIPISDVLFEALSKLEQTGQYVLPNVAHRYSHNPGGISRDTKKLLLAAGLTPKDEGSTRRLRAVSRLSFYGFRHTAASMLINGGVNPLVVRDMLGHSTVDMTARYTHVSLESKVKAVQNLPVLSAPKALLQTTSIAERLPLLAQQDLTRIGGWLDANLSEYQKHQLLNVL